MNLIDLLNQILLLRGFDYRSVAKQASVAYENYYYCTLKC
jgi:hypothetical protein